MASLKHIAANAILAVFLCGSLCAQELVAYRSGVGFNAGLNMAFGTHFQRLGINLNFFYVNRFFQANSELRAYLNFKAPGPHLRYPELLLSEGIVIGYGAKKTGFNPFLSSVSNQTGYLNSVAYSYNAWFNRVKTTQQTGIIAIQVHQFSFITENDILARQTLDRFRTAACLIQYQHENQFQAAVNCSMWTGSMGGRHETMRPEFYSGCYMDTTGGVYTNVSHGLLSAQFRYHAGYSQNVQLNAGVDAEQVRNALQNRIIHDMRFIPKKWNKARNCHIPMLDETNAPYLYEEGQKIRRPRLFLNAFTNANLFY